MKQEHNEYDFEKAQHYTEQLVQLARRRWGDVPMTPKTMTWSDGTVSVIVRHTKEVTVGPNGVAEKSKEWVMNFQETGFDSDRSKKIRETVEHLNREGEVVDSSSAWVRFSEIEQYDIRG